MLRWLTRWWVLVPAALLLLPLSALVAVRILGERWLAQVQSDLRAAGRPDTYEAWRAGLPPTDPEAADALHAAVMATPLREVGSHLSAVLAGPQEPQVSPARRALFRRSATVARTATMAVSATAAWESHQRRLASILAEQATAAAMVRTALAHPVATLSRRHRWPATATETADRIVHHGPDLWMDLLAVREAADHLRAQALTGSDPQAALADLRRLSAAAADGQTVMDAMIGMAIQGISDDTHLDALLAGRADGPAVAEWLAERPDPVACLHRGLIGERCGFGALIHAMDTMDVEGKAGPVASLAAVAWWWTVRGHDLAFRERMLADMEDALSTGVAVVHTFPGDTWADRLLRPVSMAETIKFVDCHVAALEFDARFRTARAVSILIMESRSGLMPRVPPAAIGPLLDAGPLRFRLGMEFLGGRRIRVALNPAAPQPSVFFPARYRVDRCLGAPPGALRRPGRSEHEGIEIELPP